MEDKVIPSIEQHFSDLTDPRIDRTKLHKLIDILVIAICAVIAGADNWEDVEEFGKARLEWFQTFLELPNGIPSHDTFTRVFARLDPEQFQACFLRWIAAVSEVLSGQVIAIDGKVLRRSQDRRNDKGAIDMVSAWATDNRLVLGQVKVDEKSNEITAIPQLLEARYFLPVSGIKSSINLKRISKSGFTFTHTIFFVLTSQPTSWIIDLTNNFSSSLVAHSQLSRRFSKVRAALSMAFSGTRLSKSSFSFKPLTFCHQ